MEKGFITITDSEIKESLKGVTRQYIVGNLQKPQNLKFLRREDIEIGITNYDEYNEEQPHFHTVVTEFQYMISGWTKYKDLDTEDIFEFKKGDFYAIETGTRYAQKSKKGTKILFIKVPSSNDKNTIDIDDEIAAWYKEGLKTVRKDYSHAENMPVANSIRPASAVAIVNDNKILMLKRKDNGKWTMPGGTMELTESLTECAIREFKEETNVDVKILDVIGTYTDPDIRIEYSDGEVRREFTVVYYGTAVGDYSVEIDDESSKYRWVELEDVESLPMAESQRRRINDVCNYLKTKEKNFR